MLDRNIVSQSNIQDAFTRLGVESLVHREKGRTAVWRRAAFERELGILIVWHIGFSSPLEGGGRVR